MEASLTWIDVIWSLALMFATLAMVGWTVALRFHRLKGIQPGRKRSPDEAIVVAVNGSAESARAVELACRLETEKHGKIILGSVIEVPLKYEINAPLPELEEKASDALRSAAVRVQQRRLEYESRIVRNRTAAGGLSQLARDANAGMVVVGFTGSLETGLSDLVVVSDLFRQMPCEILVAREPVGDDRGGFHMRRLIEPSIHA